VERELCLSCSLLGDGLFGLFFRVLYLGRVSRKGRKICGRFIPKERCLLSNIFIMS
jgi:hypothetical protein